MTMPNVAIIEDDMMKFYRYTDASRSSVEVAIAPKNVSLMGKAFPDLKWTAIKVAALTPAARDALAVLPVLP